MSVANALVRDLVRSSPVAGSVLAAVLREIARRQRVARGEIAGALQLSPATVSKAVGRLIQIGLLRNDSPRSNQRGRPVVPLLWSDNFACVGVSVIDRDGRPSQLVGVATGLDGQPIGTPTRQWLDDAARRDGDELLRRVATFVDTLARQPGLYHRNVLGVGVQVGGHVHEGVVRPAVDAGQPGRGEPFGSPAAGLDVRGPLQSLTGRPVAVDNDMTALAVYESFYGATDASSYVIVVVSYDGVGAGVVLNGRVWRGHAAMAGEVGHIRVRSDQAARECRSGHRGCVEAYSTPASIVAQLGEPPDAAMRRTMGDRDAATFSAAGEALGYALATIVNGLNPEKIIVYLPSLLASYGWQQGGRRYLQGMRSAMRRSCFSTGADTAVEEVYVSGEELEDRCARAAAGLVLEAIVADVEVREGGDEQVASRRTAPGRRL
jgi:predicted NBD/HSP70 family sugar kinase